MGGKSVILSVLITSLVMVQIKVEASSCCPTSQARNTFNVCRFTGASRQTCASVSGCRIVQGSCPGGSYKYEFLQYSDDAVNEYCKLGCTSSVCGAMITLQNNDASEIVNEAVEKCTNACSTFCTKGSKTAIEAA